jgi:hypothetical protein
MKAMGVAEAGNCGVAASIANAVYNAAGLELRGFWTRCANSLPPCLKAPEQRPRALSKAPNMTVGKGEQFCREPLW